MLESCNSSEEEMILGAQNQLTGKVKKKVHLNYKNAEGVFSLC